MQPLPHLTLLLCGRDTLLVCNLTRLPLGSKTRLVCMTEVLHEPAVPMPLVAVGCRAWEETELLLLCQVLEQFGCPPELPLTLHRPALSAAAGVHSGEHVRVLVQLPRLGPDGASWDPKHCCFGKGVVLKELLLLLLLLRQAATPTPTAEKVFYRNGGALAFHSVVVVVVVVWSCTSFPGLSSGRLRGCKAKRREVCVSLSDSCRFRNTVVPLGRSKRVSALFQRHFKSS